MRQSVWERFAHLSRFELGLYYAEQFLSPFSILQHQWSHSHPWNTKMVQPFYQLAKNQPVKYFECFSQLCRVVLVFCLATAEQMFTLWNFARCPPASSSSPWTRQSRVSRFRWRRTRWQGSAPADWSETSWKRKRWSASDSNYGQLRFSTNHIITCPFQDKMKKDLENEKPPRPRSGFAPSTSWLAGALSLILSHFDPSNNCQGWIREAIVREVQLFFNIVQTGDGGQTHVQKLCCKFCIIQRAIW